MTIEQIQIAIASYVLENVENHNHDGHAAGALEILQTQNLVTIFDVIEDLYGKQATYGIIKSCTNVG